MFGVSHNIISILAGMQPGSHLPEHHLQQRLVGEEHTYNLLHTYEISITSTVLYLVTSVLYILGGE